MPIPAAEAVWIGMFCFGAPCSSFRATLPPKTAFMAELKEETRMKRNQHTTHLPRSQRIGKEVSR